MRLQIIRIIQTNHSVNFWASGYMSQYSLKFSLTVQKFKFHACLFTGAKFSFSNSNCIVTESIEAELEYLRAVPTWSNVKWLFDFSSVTLRVL